MSKRVEENEPKAQALGYKSDAANVDNAKFKSFQGGQSCVGCKFFKSKAGDAWGPCGVFRGREVSAKGWCSAWALIAPARPTHEAIRAPKRAQIAP